MRPELDVEVSVVNTDNRDLLRQCLSSLAGACVGLRWRATVVDNASTDGSAAMIRAEFPGTRLLSNRVRLGFSANHNQVLRRVVEGQTARYALILNEDTYLDPLAVSLLVSFCDAHRQIGAAGPSIRGEDGSPQASLYPFPTMCNQVGYVLRHIANTNWRGTPAWLNGSCLLLRTQALCQVGLLDERFFIFFEDTDLGLRLVKAGWSSSLYPQAGMVHYGHRTVSHPRRAQAMERQMRRSQYLFFLKHKGRFHAAQTAHAVGAAIRLRAVKARLLATLRGDASQHAKADRLFDLARYDPRVLLAHEGSVRETFVQSIAKG